jgi:tRNA pseudouridine55 synthase
MDGLLLVDKPAGPTSHDVVARMRRVLRERRVGHTGTLDPAATGLLALVVGRATRLAQFMNTSDKSYEAVVRIGFATDTRDASGLPIGERYEGALPSRDELERTLDAFRGTFRQQPPAFSAKRVAGKRSHALARARISTLPAPTTVTTAAINIVRVDNDLVTLTVDCSAGFYVRSLAHDLGEALGSGAHLAALRRTRIGEFTLDESIALEAAERDPEQAASRVLPLSRLLTAWSPIVLTADGVRRALHGRDLGPTDAQTGFGMGDLGCVRLLDPSGDLIGIAGPARTIGLLHPSVVLV